MKPYTYLIGWKNQNKYYYGVRYAKQCHPSELMITYFTSSQAVSNMIKQHGTPDVIQVRKTFNDVEDARAWEHKVLRRLRVVESEQWLNKTDNKSIAPITGESNPMYGKTGTSSHRYGTKHTDKAKQIIGEKSKRKRGNMPPDFSEKMRSIVSGRTHTEETKNKIKEKLTGRTISEEHKKNISKNHADSSGDKNPFYGKKHSAEAKAKMKESRAGLKWIHNTTTGQRTLIHVNEVDRFLSLGWTKGKGK